MVTIRLCDIDIKKHISMISSNIFAYINTTETASLITYSGHILGLDVFGQTTNCTVNSDGYNYTVATRDARQFVLKFKTVRDFRNQSQFENYVRRMFGKQKQKFI